MLRVCELHRERAVETLVSKKDGVEYDLCVECVALMQSILSGETEKPNEEEKPVSGTRRGRPCKTTSGA